MKIHLAWIRMTATAAVLAGAGAQPVAAQYAPYQPTTPVATQPVANTVTQQAAQPVAPAPTRVAATTPYWQQAAPQQQVATQPVVPYPQTSAAYVPGVAQPQVQPQAPTYAQQAPVYAQQQQPAYVAQAPTYTQQAPAYGPTTAYAPSPAYAPNPTYGPTAAQGRTYPYVAYQPNSPEPTIEETIPPPAGAEQSVTMPHGASQYAQPVPAGGYPNGGYPDAQGSYPSYYSGEGCNEGHGLSKYFDNPCHDTVWFGGVYWLFMERDRPAPRKMTVSVDHSTMPPSYYPQGDRTVLVSPDHDFRSGVEVRFGSTFAIGDGCDPCCAPQTYAWEIGWWGLDDDLQQQTTVQDFTGMPDTRRYGMINFAGLEHDGGGAGYRPMNEYYGYSMPIEAPVGMPMPGDPGYYTVVAQRVRTNFQAQNLELNIIRFPICNIGGGSCNTGCDPCQASCAPKSCFSMFGSCGVRYFRTDDDFGYDTEYGTYVGGGNYDDTMYDGWRGDSNQIYYDIQVDNNLVGPQLGWMMNYCVGCKWNFFLNSNFGIMANMIEHQQSMWSNGGMIRYTHSQNDFYVESDKTDIAFLGELRAGGSYDISCNWRAMLAYRAFALSGIATATEQIATDYTNGDWVGLIDSNNSLIIHGIQAGIECRY